MQPNVITNLYLPDNKYPPDDIGYYNNYTKAYNESTQLKI